MNLLSSRYSTHEYVFKFFSKDSRVWWLWGANTLIFIWAMPNWDSKVFQLQILRSIIFWITSSPWSGIWTVSLSSNSLKHDISHFKIIYAESNKASGRVISLRLQNCRRGKAQEHSVGKVCWNNLWNSSKGKTKFQQVHQLRQQSRLLASLFQMQWFQLQNRQEQCNDESLGQR